AAGRLPPDRRRRGRGARHGPRPGGPLRRRPDALGRAGRVQRARGPHGREAVIERGGRREERVRRLCLRLWRRRGRPGVSHFLSEQEILALAENAIRSSGGELQGDEIAKLLAWVESVRVAAVLIDMAVAQEVAVRPGVNGEGEFGMRPDTAAPGHGPVPHPLAVDPAALAALRELLAENPARSNARLAAIVM